MDTNALSPWTKLYNLLKLDRKDIFQVFYYAIFAGIISLTLPLGIQAIINMLQGAQVSSSWVVLTILVTIGVGFVGVLQVIQLSIIENIQEKVFTRASFEFVFRFPKMRVRELEDSYPPELSNRFFDVLTLQKGLQKLLLDFPTAVIQILFGLLLLSFYHPFFIALGLVLLVMLYIFFKLSLNGALRTSIQESKSKYAVLFWIQQVANNYKTFKVSNNEFELDKNNQLIRRYLKNRQNHFRLVKNQFKKMVGFKVFVIMGLLFIGGLLVLNQQMNIGQFVAAEIVIILIMNSVEKIMLSLETLYDIVTAVEKIDEVNSKRLDWYAETNEERISIFPLVAENLQLDNQPVGKLTFEKNTAVNIVGNHQQIYDLYHYLAGMKKSGKGKVYLNRREISTVSLAAYRQEIGWVAHTDYFFEASLWQNLTLNNLQVSEDKVYNLLEDFGILSTIQKLPKTINTYVFPGSKLLSKPTARKICLIRALLKKPRLLFVEEGFVTSSKEYRVLLDYARKNDITVLLATTEKIDFQLQTIFLNP